MLTILNCWKLAIKALGLNMVLSPLQGPGAPLKEAHADTTNGAPLHIALSCLDQQPVFHSLESMEGETNLSLIMLYTFQGRLGGSVG